MLFVSPRVPSLLNSPIIIASATLRFVIVLAVFAVIGCGSGITLLGLAVWSLIGFHGGGPLPSFLHTPLILGILALVIVLALFSARRAWVALSPAASIHLAAAQFKCSNCGKDIESNASNCTSCGFRFGSSSDAATLG